MEGDMGEDLELDESRKPSRRRSNATLALTSIEREVQ
jgi:hypothetical protein